MKLINKPITEALRTTMQRRTKLDKINAAAGGECMKIAKERGDAFYDKYQKFNKKRLILKEQIKQRYWKFAIQRVKQKMLQTKEVTTGKKKQLNPTTPPKSMKLADG